MHANRAVKEGECRSHPDRLRHWPFQHEIINYSQRAKDRRSWRRGFAWWFGLGIQGGICVWKSIVKVDVPCLGNVDLGYVSYHTHPYCNFLGSIINAVAADRASSANFVVSHTGAGVRIVPRPLNARSSPIHFCDISFCFQPSLPTKRFQVYILAAPSRDSGGRDF